MKFSYQYRTRENEIRVGEVDAVDRDAAYAELRKRGIKASRMEEAPGLINKLFGKGKRWIAIVLLGCVAVFATWLWLITERKVVLANRIDEAVPRHQIYGDPEIVAKFASYDGLKAVLGNDGDALLACFAQPGKAVDVGGRRDYVALLSTSITNTLSLVQDDTREVRELKQIVNWMRAEMLTYVNYNEDCRPIEIKLSAYFNRVVQRVANEKRIYSMIERELLGCADERIREEKNARLRRLGLPPIVAPYEPAR